MPALAGLLTSSVIFLPANQPGDSVVIASF
jgi:hypothetical protein